jgi:transcriptional regulator with XRE-family HTH domain
MDDMNDAVSRIADKMRGVAAEKRATQGEVAGLLGIGRKAVNDRMNGRVPWTAAELLVLSEAWGVPVASLFPVSGRLAGVA